MKKNYFCKTKQIKENYKKCELLLRTRDYKSKYKIKIFYSKRN